ncbi:MAG: DUF5655 domain-containing protein, partial [Vicinamibacterales bacterium]
VLRNRPPEVVKLYAALEKFAKSLGPVEFVTRERYVLLRSNRIFADAVIMSDALRLAIHLPRKAEHKLFMKVASVPRPFTAASPASYSGNYSRRLLKFREAGRDSRGHWRCSSARCTPS